MQQKYYCPTCKEEIEVIAACGSSGYFCNKCKKLISSKEILTEETLESNGDKEKKKLT